MKGLTLAVTRYAQLCKLEVGRTTQGYGKVQHKSTETVLEKCIKLGGGPKFK